jgi:hypothetical protein
MTPKGYRMLLGANIKVFRDRPAFFKPGDSHNANALKPEYSRDFIRIRVILEKRRKKERIKQTEKQINRRACSKTN